MNENWRSLAGFEHDGTGPDRLPLWTTSRLNSSDLKLTRDVRADIQTRDPHRSASAVVPVLSTYSLEWDFPITSAAEYLLFVLCGIADAGRTTEAGGDYTFRIGRGKDPVRSNIYMDGVDGSHYKLHGCLLTDWTLNIDLIDQISSQVTFAARRLELLGSAAAFAAAPSSGRPATALDSSVVIGGVEYPVFGWSVGFQREAAAAGLDEDGTAEAWDGNQVPDIGGKITCRCPSADFDAAMTETLTKAIQAVINLPGGAVLTMDFPRCILQAASKRIVGPELFEFSLEWSAVQPESGDNATITLEA